MPRKNFTAFCGAATLALGFAFSAAPAHAGFQWSEPKEGASVSVPELSAVTPAAVSGPESISPLIISGTTGASLSQAAAPVHPKDIPAAPPSAAKGGGRFDLATETISMATPPPVAAVPIGAPASDSIVQGFASQVPLALALRQILPGNVSFLIDQGVDADTLVSYKGGKPWGETLKATLAPAGLDYHQQGNAVTISKASAAVAEKLPPSQSSQIVEASFAKPKSAITSLPAVEKASPQEKPSIQVSSADGWSADRGDTLHKVLVGWCNRAGVELKWLSEFDYPIEASAHFTGGFEDAVRNLFAGFNSAKPQPVGELHVNPKAGQEVLVVQARGNSYSN